MIVLFVVVMIVVLVVYDDIGVGFCDDRGVNSL